MRIVIDMQGAQTPSRFRGIGRYTIAMVQSLLRIQNQHEIFLAFNGMMPESIALARQQLSGLIKDENVLVWQGPGLVSDQDPRNLWRRRAAEECYKTFLQDIQADLLFISSYFEGYRDNAVAFVAAPEFGFATCSVVYDLIPLLNADQYLIDPIFSKHYQRKLQEIQHCAAVLTISEFSRTEALEHLSFRPDQVVNTYLGADERFCSLSLDLQQQQEKRQALGLERPFILYTGGSDERKNLPRLVRAYAALPLALRQTYQLVFAGKFVEADQAYLLLLAQELKLDADALHFTGYISDDVLIELYNLCVLFVFPSWHEGFGLPVLEAMACGAPAIAGQCSSLPEVLAFPEALFDPLDVQDISQKMAQVLMDEGLRQRLLAHSFQYVKKFSWGASAAVAMTQFEKVLREQTQKTPLTGAAIDHELRVHYEDLIARIGSFSKQGHPPSAEDLRTIAWCIEANQLEARRVCQRVRLPEQSAWFFETSAPTVTATFDMLANGLSSTGQHLARQLVDANVVIEPLPTGQTSESHTQVHLSSGLRLRQTVVLEDWVTTLNAHAYGVLAPSPLSRKLLIDAGVYVPIAVSPAGMDDWIETPVATHESLTEKKYRFVCDISDVELDGLDLLLSAYAQAFTLDNDVSLVVLAVPACVEAVRTEIASWRARAIGLGEVVLVTAASDATRKAAYVQAHCLVAPYRFQDNPLAEARAAALGLAVLTTGWCALATDALPLIDYQFERAPRGASLTDTYWAVPDTQHLAQLLRAQLEGASTRPVTHAVTTRADVRTWVEAAGEINRLAREWSTGPTLHLDMIGWVSTWNTRCGIASYSEHLVRCMPESVMIFAPCDTEQVAADDGNVVRCWDIVNPSLTKLSRALDRQAIRVLVVQFNYGFFDFYAFSSFLMERISRQTKVVVTLHSSTDSIQSPERRLSLLAPVLKRCHRVIVHSIGDLNRLKALGVMANVYLMPLGVLQHNLPTEPKGWQKRRFLNYFSKRISLATYGFFLPHKGLLEMIEAIALMRANGCHVSLDMVNAEYPIEASRALILEAQAKIQALGLEKHINLKTDFLNDHESIALLLEADMIVFPYQETGESASAAVRFGLVAGRPVAVTPLAIFDDVDAAVFRLPGFSAQAIAEGVQHLIAELQAQTEATQDKLRSASAWCAAHAYPKVAARLTAMLKAPSP